MKKYEILIFDLDDTLLDFKAAEKASLKKLFVNNNIEYSNHNIDIYRRINDVLWGKLEQGLITKDEVVFSRFTLLCDILEIEGDGNAMELEYRSYLNKSTQIIPGAIELLQTVRENGYKVYAATNGLANTQRSRLSDSNMSQYFDDLFISEELGHEKPSINFFNILKDGIPNFKDSNALMIGDSLTSDIEGANRANIDSCWFNPNNSYVSDNATYTINSFSQLYEII